MAKTGKKKEPILEHKIIVNMDDPEEVRVCLLEGGRLQAYQVESETWLKTRGNIYKGRITNIEPGLQAVFVDIGRARNAYLPLDDIHPEYYGNPENGRKAPELLQKGQEVLVQIVKEESAMKGPAVTTYLSIPGRFLVIMPGTDQVGVSRKIEEEAERKRLKELLAELTRPEGVGLIVRTVTEGMTKKDVKQDLSYLLRLWQDLKKKAQKASTPSLLYTERDLVARFLRDYLTSDVTEIAIDDQAACEDVKAFLKIISPKHEATVRYYDGLMPIFSHYGVEVQIEEIFRRRVELPSGGSLIIEPTEALVAIDVNSGKLIHEKEFEETAYNTNLEAAEEVARQLRLRDLAGIIVVDFIDMRPRANREGLERRMKELLKRDKARTEVSRVGPFGLIEIVRQKIGAPVQMVQHRTCPCCAGKGIVRTVESLAVTHLRALREWLAKEHGEVIKVILEVQPAVAFHMLNAKRAEIARIEGLREVKIHVEGNPGLGMEEFRIARATET